VAEGEAGGRRIWSYSGNTVGRRSVEGGTKRFGDVNRVQIASESSIVDLNRWEEGRAFLQPQCFLSFEQAVVMHSGVSTEEAVMYTLLHVIFVHYALHGIVGAFFLETRGKTVLIYIGYVFEPAFHAFISRELINTDLPQIFVYNGSPFQWSVSIRIWGTVPASAETVGTRCLETPCLAACAVP
jgi:hypothetical protein